MISINSGKLIIPDEERFIGFAGDNLQEEKQFVLENVDDESCIYRLYLKFDDDTVNYFVLDSKVENGSTILNWTILEEHIFKSGIVEAQIKSISESGKTYHTTWDYFYVSPSAEFSGEFTDNENSEFLLYEKKLNELYQKIEEADLDNYVSKSTTIADIELYSDITASQLCDAIGVFPMTFKEGAPTVFDGYVGRFLIDTVNNDLYYCDKRTLSGCNWIKLSNSSEAVNSIENAEINENGELVLTYSDSTSVNLGVVVGKDGDDGASPQLSVSPTSNGIAISITTADGAAMLYNILNGTDGQDGYTPIKGTDYYTDEDKAEFTAENIAYISQELSQRSQLTPEFANSIAECEDTAKLYVLPDGYIYAYMLTTNYPEISVTKQAGGFWQLIENVPTWQTNSAYYGWNTNLIPVTSGDILSYDSGYSDKYVPAVVWYDSAQAYISSEYGATEYTAPSSAQYAQFFSYNQDETIGDLSVSWVNCQNATAFQWTNTGHAFVPADYEKRIIALENKVTDSVLYGKKIVYDGDSICESRTGSDANNGGAYAKLIAERTGSTYVNQAVSGARLTSAVDGATYHSVVDNLTNLPTDGDLYCFEGGINDYWTPKNLGTFSKTDFTDELDTNTVCGALETVFRYALENFAGKPICFVITHKVQSTAYVANSNGDTFEDYRNAMVGICKKYSIPYYDAFSESGLNGWNEVQNNAYLTSNSVGTPDGCHPNEEGYKRYYVPQLISLFESIMPQ